MLRGQTPPVTAEDFDKAALQFVRKISGFAKPSRANQAVFERAVNEVAAAGRKLLESIEQREIVPGAAATPHPNSGVVNLTVEGESR